MKNRSSKRKNASTPSKVKHALRRKKSNEVTSDPSLRSSLTSDVGLAPSLDDVSETAGQAGDVQGISNVADADPESVEELLKDGQALEAEVISGVEDAPDENELPRRRRIEDEPPHSFDQRNKI